MIDGKLRAAEEEGAKRVRTLPDVDVRFPTEELAEHYDVVHQGFRRELNRPGEMGLDPGTTQDAVKALERVAPTLDPRRIATDIILPLFRGERWQDVSDERLYRYTRFLMQHSSETRAAMEKSNIKVKIRGTTRHYLPPSQTYFGHEYSMDGERLDRLCAHGEGVSFLSADYLEQASETKDDWIRFFSERGVASQPRIHTSTHQIAEWDLDELRRSTEDSWPAKISLRASSINDIRAYHFALHDFALDPPIHDIVQELYNVKPPGWKDRLGYFADILEAGWDEYRSKLKKELRYARLSSSYINRRQVTALTTFAKFLKDEPWLPIVDDLRISKRPCELVLNTEENRGLANKETPLSLCTFEEPSLISFLDIKEHPPETTPLLRLQYAVDRQEDDISVFESLYADLASDPGFDTHTLRAAFRDHRLIFAPGHDLSYVTHEETLYASRTVLAPRMAAIGDVYPNLEEFFTEALGIPTAERLEHFVEYLRDYIWEYRPAISDNLHSAVESCYRRLFNHLDETQEEAREEALSLLKEQLGFPTMVFCGVRGWVSTTESIVLYPDAAAYEGLLSERSDIAIESHLKRLAQPLSEIRMLLDALNVRPMSEAIRRVPDIGDVNVHAQSTEFGEHLSLLVRKAIAVVQQEQAKTESTSRNVNLFLQEWKERSEALFRNVKFFESLPIKVRDELVTDGTTLREMQWGAYVSAEGDHLSIYMSGNLLDVFDSVADRIMEVLLSSIKPEHLMFGKLIGLGSASLLQMAVWSVTVGVFLLVLNLIIDLPIEFTRELVPSPARLLIAFAYFLLGYGFIGTLLAAIGAVTTNQRQAGNITTFVILPAIAPMWFMFVLIENPEGTLARVLSFVPITAPVTSLTRLSLDGMDGIDVFFSLAVLTLSVAVVVWLTARLFRAYLLVYGQQPSMGHLIRTLRGR